MPRGRKPIGERAMTGAERQARHIAKQRADQQKAVAQARRRAKRPSRAAQWEDAVLTLVELQQEFQEWRDSLPENLQGGILGEKLDAICDLDLSELEGIEVPLGFGRD
jgi:hypothetical protein